LPPGGERVAILKASGGGLDLTDDYTKLHEALAGLKARGKPEARSCPYMSYYMADAIVNQEDKFAIAAATRDAMECAFSGNSKAANAARQYALRAAREKDALGRTHADAVLGVLKHLVAAMANAPGERIIVVVSPGFLSDDPKHAQVLDTAVRDDIVISALDPRGLVPVTDVTQQGAFDPEKLKYKSLSETAETAVLEDLADATGGVFFHNNNDVGEGFRRVSARPEYSYVLAFSPENAKADGKFHKLKVKLNNKSGAVVQARKGYYSPKPGA
jgi:VWFA-related protein